MSFRTEEKFFINSDKYVDLKNYLILKGANRQYPRRLIKSIYFDNDNLQSFIDSQEGSVVRKKIRIRNYPNESDKSFYIEKKISSVEGRYKTRNIINKEKVDYFKKFGIFDNQYGQCFPNLYVTYKREYSILDDTKISIDKEILYENYKTNIVYKDHKAIVEIKTSIKKNLDDLVKSFPFQRTRFSKYCDGIEKI